MQFTYIFHQINNGHLSVGSFAALFTLFFWHQRPQFVQVDRRTEFVVAIQMEVSHAQFTKVARMVFIEIDAMMMHASSITTTSRMLTVFTWNIKQIESI